LLRGITIMVFMNYVALTRWLKPSRLFLLATLCGFSVAEAGPLQQAEVNKIVNDVRIVSPQERSTRPAKLKDVVKDDIAVRTGVQSRAELLFQDNTLSRLGAESLFSFKAGTRDMTLDRGTMLLQVPKGLGGARIQTAAVTAAITGTTIMIENIPGSHVKVLVLEGSLRLTLNARLGESVVLTLGKMVILGEKDKRLPKPVAVDLEKLVKTSALIDPEKFRGKAKIKVEPLPSIALIEKEIAIQTGAKEKSRLAETNLLIEGDGTKVTVASKETMAALEAAAKGGSAAPAEITLDDRSKRVVLDVAPLFGQSNDALPAGTGDDRHKLRNKIPDGTGTTTAVGTTSGGTTSGGTTSGGTTSGGTTSGGTTSGGTTSGGTTSGGTTSGGTTSGGTTSGGTTSGGTTSGGTTSGGTTSGGTTSGGTTSGGTTSGGTTSGGTTSGGTTSGGTTSGGTTSGGTTTPDPTVGDVSPAPDVTVTPPPAVDSTTWTFAKNPYQWADMSLKATDSSVTPVHALPPVIPASGPSTIDATVHFVTGGTPPTISNAKGSASGTIYGGRRSGLRFPLRK
jgi:hypothetical protein